MKCLAAQLAATADDRPDAGTRGYDVLSYDLDLRLDPARSHISGRVDIRLRAEDTFLGQVHLDLVPELTVLTLLQDGSPAAFTRNGADLSVLLTRGVLSGDDTVLTVTYDGHPPRHGPFQSGLMFRRHNAGTLTDPSDDMPIVANVSQPWSAHSWWPCKDDPHDKALVSLAAAVPDTLRVVSNGTLESTSTPEPGWTRYAWREAYPLPTYLVSVAASDYVDWQELCAPSTGPAVRLEYYVFPADRAKAEIDFAPTCDMLALMTDLAGPYPFTGEKYAQAEIKWTGAMEHSTATSISQIFLTGDRSHETLIIHELAHQWFGDSLTPRTWADLWLNEGFARYCEGLWLESAYGPEAYVDFMAAVGTERHPDFFAEDGLLGDPDPILPNLMIYDKGAWLLHSLRLWLGDPAFFGLLADYATDPDLVHGHVARSDFQAAAEQAAGEDLSRFFDPWLDTAKVPVLSQAVRVRSCGNGEGSVHLTLGQHQTPLFKVAVPVEIYQGSQVLKRMARLETSAQVFEWAVPCGVDSVRIDPDALVLARWYATPPVALAVTGPAPNPLGPAGAAFEIRLLGDAHLSAALYDSRGRRVADYDLGPLAATGPAEDPVTDPHTWHWAPLDLDRALPAGVYWLDFRAGSHRTVRKLAYLP